MEGRPSGGGLAFDFPTWRYGSAKPAAEAPTERAWLADLDELDEPDSNPPTPPATLTRSTQACAAAAYDDDVLLAIVSLLPTAADLCAARAVSSRWREVASSDPLWSHFWSAHERFSRLQRPRRPCAFRGAFEPPPPRYPAFFDYATACRANRSGLLRWMDLQIGWTRLEAMLAPDAGLEESGASSSPQPSPRTVRPGGRRRKRDGDEDDPSAETESSLASSTAVAPSAALATLGGLELSFSAPSRLKARKLASILAARNWELLHRCVLLLQLECAEQLARAIVPRTSHPQPSDETLAVADELLLVRVVEGWRSYNRWLSGLCGCFAHHAGSSCRTHLICLLAAQRSTENVDQHTPSLLHAGFAAFRHSVLLQPIIGPALARHVTRATASVMAQGGFTHESGRLMQLLIDLQNVCTTVDLARDDHLCEERGERFTQEALRETLLTPIREFWALYSRTWFCGTKVDEESLSLYEGSRHRRRQERRAATRDEPWTRVGGAQSFVRPDGASSVMEVPNK